MATRPSPFRFRKTEAVVTLHRARGRPGTFQVYPQFAGEPEAFLGVEGLMDKARKALGNSTTARQQSELGLAGQFIGHCAVGGVGGVGYGRSTSDNLAFSEQVVINSMTLGRPTAHALAMLLRSDGCVSVPKPWNWTE